MIFLGWASWARWGGGWMAESRRDLGSEHAATVTSNLAKKETSGSTRGRASRSRGSALSSCKPSTAPPIRAASDGMSRSLPPQQLRARTQSMPSNVDAQWLRHVTGSASLQRRPKMLPSNHIHPIPHEARATRPTALGMRGSNHQTSPAWSNGSDG